MPYGPESGPPPGRGRDAGMSEADAVAGVLLVGATMYAVFGGADFGAGLLEPARGRRRPAAGGRAS